MLRRKSTGFQHIIDGPITPLFKGGLRSEIVAGGLCTNTRENPIFANPLSLLVFFSLIKSGHSMWKKLNPPLRSKGLKRDDCRHFKSWEYWKSKKRIASQVV
jgi:hypothetical protein